MLNISREGRQAALWMWHINVIMVLGRSPAPPNQVPNLQIPSCGVKHAAHLWDRKLHSIPALQAWRMASKVLTWESKPCLQSSSTKQQRCRDKDEVSPYMTTRETEGQHLRAVFCTDIWPQNCCLCASVSRRVKQWEFVLLSPCKAPALSLRAANISAHIRLWGVWVVIASELWVTLCRDPHPWPGASGSYHNINDKQPNE